MTGKPLTPQKKMKRILIHILICALSAIASFAQTDPERAIKEISEAAASVKTMQCGFEQTKTLKMLGDKLVSKGLMICSQPDKLRWEYLSPYAYTFILNGSKVTILRGGRTDVIDVNTSKMFREIARIMMDSVLGKCLTDKKNFKVTVSSEGNSYVATLIPQKKTLRQMFGKIVLHFDRSLAMVTTVELFENNGDNTSIRLFDIKKNEPVDETQF